jgi:hypothetical protein
MKLSASSQAVTARLPAHGQRPIDERSTGVAISDWFAVRHSGTLNLRGDDRMNCQAITRLNSLDPEAGHRTEGLRQPRATKGEAA